MTNFTQDQNEIIAEKNSTLPPKPLPWGDRVGGRATIVGDKRQENAQSLSIANSRNRSGCHWEKSDLIYWTAPPLPPAIQR